MRIILKLFEAYLSENHISTTNYYVKSGGIFPLIIDLVKNLLRAYNHIFERNQ